MIILVAEGYKRGTKVGQYAEKQRKRQTSDAYKRCQHVEEREQSKSQSREKRSSNARNNENAAHQLDCKTDKRRKEAHFVDGERKRGRRSRFGERKQTIFFLLFAQLYSSLAPPAKKAATTRSRKNDENKEDSKANAKNEAAASGDRAEKTRPKPTPRRTDITKQLDALVNAGM